MSPRPEDDDRDGAALEYVLGTLDRQERETFERRLGADPEAAARVAFWQERLAPLARGAAPVEPSPEVWRAVAAAVSTGGPATAAPTTRVQGAPPATVLPFLLPELGRLRRSRAIWRAAAIAASLAAAIAVFVATRGIVAPGQARDRLVAVVNRSGDLPALIVRVDPSAGLVSVRSLAAETPADHSLELWSIVGDEPPRSLGVVSIGTIAHRVPVADRSRLEGATLAVSVEPPGGSKTGAPTGPVVYKGRLVPDPD